MLALLALLLFPTVVQTVTGDPWVVVTGGSMSPTLDVGNLIVIDEHGPARVGDVVTVRRPDSSLVTHRIIGVADDGALELRGDANTVADPAPVPRDAVVGTVTATIHHPWSTVLRAATSPAGRLTLVGTIALILFAPRFLARPRSVDSRNR